MPSQAYELPSLLQASGRSPKPSNVTASSAAQSSAIATCREGRWLAIGLTNGAVTGYVAGFNWGDIDCAADAASPITALAWGPPSAATSAEDVCMWSPLAAGSADGAVAVHDIRYVHELVRGCLMKKGCCSFSAKAVFAGSWKRLCWMCNELCD